MKKLETRLIIFEEKGILYLKVRIRKLESRSKNFYLLTSNIQFLKRKDDVVWKKIKKLIVQLQAVSTTRWESKSAL